MPLHGSRSQFPLVEPTAQTHAPSTQVSFNSQLIRAHEPTHCPSRQNSVSGLHSTAAHGSPRHSLMLQFGSSSGQRQLVFWRWSHPVLYNYLGRRRPSSNATLAAVRPSARSTQTPVESSQYCPVHIRYRNNRSAKPTCFITSGIWCNAFVESADFEAFAFKAAITIWTDSLIVDQAIAIVIHAITNFFSCFGAIAITPRTPSSIRPSQSLSTHHTSLIPLAWLVCKFPCLLDKQYDLTHVRADRLSMLHLLCCPHRWYHHNHCRYCRKSR